MSICGAGQLFPVRSAFNNRNELHTFNANAFQGFNQTDIHTSNKRIFCNIDPLIGVFLQVEHMEAVAGRIRDHWCEADQQSQHAPVIVALLTIVAPPISARLEIPCILSQSAWSLLLAHHHFAIITQIAYRPMTGCPMQKRVLWRYGHMEIIMSPTPSLAPPSLTLNDGYSIPQIGLGVWNIKSEDTAAVVASALQKGYRLLDGAFIYGNEDGLGEGIRRSDVARDEIFITTKVWNGDQGRAKTKASVERSLKAIGVDQIDLMLIHWPCPAQDLYVETWQTLIDLRKDGLLKSIGVSNFNKDHLERLIAETGETPAVNQIEVNPKLQQDAICAVNQAHGIVTQAWTPLGNGASFDATAIQSAAKRTGKSPAQIILRWHLQSGRVVIPRSVNPERQMQNIDLFDFELSNEEMSAIKTLDVGERTGPDPATFG